MRSWCLAAAVIVAVWYGPAPSLVPALGLALGLVAVAATRRGGKEAAVLTLLGLLGWAHGGLALDRALDARLPASLHGESRVLEGRVTGLPEGAERRRYGETGFRQTLVLDARAVSAPGWPGRHRVRLTAWSPLARLNAGDRVRLEARLYRPRDWYNETGGDLARKDLAQGIDARGEIRHLNRMERRPGSLHARRAALSERLRRHLDGTPLGAAVIPALVTGDRRGLDPELSGLFRDLGTAHLLAISGLHLTLVTGLLWALGRGVLAPLASRGCRRLRRLSLQQLAWAPALAGAVGYAALAGFSIPTRRALIMVAVLAACRLARRAPPGHQVLGLALAAVLLADPLAALDAGLWLSFTAVALILLLSSGTRLPLLMTLPVAMAVIASALFDQWAWWSPLANLLLVPLFSMLVIPLALLGTALDQPALLSGAATGVEASVWLMEKLDTLPAPSPPPLTGVAASLLLAAVVLWLTPGRPWPRWLLPLCLLPWWWPPSDGPGPGQVDLVAFEVGQGQALALRTHGHLVLYDLGPGWDGGSSVSRVVGPWLRRHRLRPDLTFVSHGDSDHAGGLKDLSPTGDLLSGEPGRVAGARPCRAGQHWRFDGVDFQVLWPRDDAWSGNAASCVLRVSAGNASILLTGDITDQVEYRLLGRVKPVSLLQLSHHGSGSSNVAPWLESLSPRWALASVGHANRFGHPARRVRADLDAAGVTLLRTDRAGMIVFRLGGPDNAALIRKWRRDHGRPWHR